jgi:uncharacterized membrane protein (DUF373 family)
MSLTKHDLTTQELMILHSEQRSAEKSLALAYLMLIGGHLGVHRFYLKRTGSAIAQLVLFLVCIAAYIGMSVVAAMREEEIILPLLVVTVAAAAVLFVWVVVDLFLLPRMIREWNDKVERDILDQIEAYRGTKVE